MQLRVLVDDLPDRTLERIYDAQNPATNTWTDTALRPIASDLYGARGPKFLDSSRSERCVPARR